MFRKFVLFKFMPDSNDLALLFLRIIAGTSILIKHGFEKVLDYPGMLERLAGNHHYVAIFGVGPSLFCAAFADAVLTVLLVLGVATRWCALLCFINLGVAWTVVLHGAYFSTHADPNIVVQHATHGEMIVAYLACLLTLFLAGGGKYSIDTLLDRKEKLA